MPYFSCVMIMGHMSFVRPEWLARLGEAWKRKIGEMEMIYDGKCGFCIRSMACFWRSTVSDRSRPVTSAPTCLRW
jgi:hypothetical protein